MNIISPSQSVSRSSVGTILEKLQEKLESRKTDSFPENIELRYPTGPHLTEMDLEIVAGLLTRAGWVVEAKIWHGMTIVRIDLPRIKVQKS